MIGGFFRTDRIARAAFHFTAKVRQLFFLTGVKMLPKPESAFFLIADISGYTSYLAGVELDHAQDIVADLMDIVVRGLRPAFRLAKFEGDAAFFVSATDQIDGSTLQDAVEAAYFNYRRRLRSIMQATTCKCSACREMRQLDLKFVCHHGEFVRQKMAGLEELAGRDVILVHRLLKNTVNQRLGGHAYVLYSDACARASGMQTAGQGLIEHMESIDVIGEVACWLHDLEEAWQKECDSRRHEVTSRNAAIVLAFDLDAPRPLVWDYITHPAKRPKWRAADKVIEDNETGRRGTGTTNHCMHGSHAIIEEITDWRPYDYLTLTTLLPVPDAPKILMTYGFSDIGNGGTRFEIRVAKPKAEDMAFLEQSGAEFEKTISAEIEVLRGLLEKEIEAAAGMSEAAIPVSAGRFRSQPVRER